MIITTQNDKGYEKGTGKIQTQQLKDKPTKTALLYILTQKSAIHHLQSTKPSAANLASSQISAELTKASTLKRPRSLVQEL